MAQNDAGSFRLFKTGEFSFKYYASGWGGGSRASITTFKLAKIGSALSYASFGAGTLLDSYGVYRYYRYGADDPVATSPGKMGLNTSVGAYGLWVNPIPAAVYFGVDLLYPGGWPSALDNNARIQQDTQQALGAPFNLYRDSSGYPWR